MNIKFKKFFYKSKILENSNEGKNVFVYFIGKYGTVIISAFIF